MTNTLYVSVYPNGDIWADGKVFNTWQEVLEHIANDTRKLFVWRA